MDPLDTTNVSKHHIPTDFVITAEMYVQMFCNPLMSNDIRYASKVTLILARLECECLDETSDNLE